MLAQRVSSRVKVVARLIQNPGKPTEKVFALQPGVNTIGRTAENNVFVLHRSLSRKHAQVVLEPTGATIEDLSSKNGTFVDGVRVSKRLLKGAHYIKCGDVVFSFVNDAAKRGAGPSGGQARTETPRAPTLICELGHGLSRMTIDDLVSRRDAAPPSAAALSLHAESPADRAEEKLQILLKVSELLSSPSGGIDVLLNDILDLLFAILDVDRGVILMVAESSSADEEGDLMSRLDPRVTKLRGDSGGHANIYSRQVVGYVIEHGVAALFADTQADPRLAGDGSIMLQSICGSMCAPLKPREEVIGVLYVDNLSVSNRFDKEDLEFLSAFANQAAIAIDNALLSAKLAREAVSRNNLLRFFPPTAIDNIMADGGQLKIHQTEATALFSDISGFTAMSSQMTPIEVITLLNAYFPVMAQVVFRHEGTLEKYIGDALLAVWGAPFKREDDAARAVVAAVEMQRALIALNDQLKLANPLRIHIGINTGTVAAGNIGSADYLQYATIGDATNVASRICDVAKAGEIVCDSRTKALLPPERWALEALDPVKVKGKTEPLQCYRVPWST